jgi:DNA-binding IclR family transcriptional regulator
MTDAEQTIVTYLASSPESLFARKEIARRAVRRQVYEENPHWADAALTSLVQQGIVEQNDQGLFRLGKDALLK